MIAPVYDSPRTKTFVWTDVDRLWLQVDTGQVRIGPDAAREIARRIEKGHGFWDRSRLETTS